jgi:hypothetical protein
MSLFSPQQLAELEARYGLVPVVEMLAVRDGSVRIDGKVWWLGEGGPELVDLSNPKHLKDNLANIKTHPESYQIEKPSTRVQYLD